MQFGGAGLEFAEVEQPEHRATGLEALNAGRRDEKRRIVAGVAVAKRSALRELSVKRGAEARLDRAS